MKISLTEPRRRSEKGLDRFGDDVVDAMQLVGRNDVGRKDINDVAEWSQQHAALQEKIVELGAEAGKIAGIVNAKFQGAKPTEMPRVAYLVEVTEVRESFGMNSGDPANSIENRLVVEDLKIRVSRGAGERVPGVGMPVIEGVQAILAAKRGFDPVGAQRSTHRQEAAGDALRNAHDIGEMLARSQANIFPVRPKPVSTSSVIRKML